MTSRAENAARQRRYRLTHLGLERSRDRARQYARTPKAKAKREVRRQQIRDLKLTLSCVDCGWSPSDAAECAALEFDHIDPDTKRRTVFGGAINATWAWQTILDEIAKCEPRCARCHRIRSYREGHFQHRHTDEVRQIDDDLQLGLFELSGGAVS